jgi:hypothetical protein
MPRSAFENKRIMGRHPDGLEARLHRSRSLVEPIEAVSWRRRRHLRNTGAFSPWKRGEGAKMPHTLASAFLARGGALWFEECGTKTGAVRIDSGQSGSMATAGSMDARPPVSVSREPGTGPDEIVQGMIA